VHGRLNHPVTIPLNPAATGILAGGRGVVRRTSFRETSGTTEAVFRLWDGTNTTGVLLDSISLAPQESARDQYRQEEYHFEGSLYLQVVSGAFEGSVTVQFLGPGEAPLHVVLAITLDDVLELEQGTLKLPSP
jgi:hypothetical protein